MIPHAKERIACADELILQRNCCTLKRINQKPGKTYNQAVKVNPAPARTISPKVIPSRGAKPKIPATSQPQGFSLFPPFSN